MKKNKVLIIRFSSFGDIVQCSSVVDILAREAVVHWATRADFESLVRLNSNLEQVFSLDKKLGLVGLINFSLKLRRENYTHVYDAHNNLRSKIIMCFLRLRLNSPKTLTRSKDRIKRILLFKFRKNLFPSPFKGIESYLTPLKGWGFSTTLSSPIVTWHFQDATHLKIRDVLKDRLQNSSFIALAPSAAWEMKRWPVDYWKKVIELMPDKNFVIFGGKDDLFCEELVVGNETRVFNLAGLLSLAESSLLLKHAQLIISGDTGLLHVADVLSVKGISLMGPTAFGFTTSTLIKTLEVNLSCRPCSKDGRGSCSQSIYKKCMIDILPSVVSEEAQKIIRD
jgi:ADP-heptose:LPS heptosyltransferase